MFSVLLRKKIRYILPRDTPQEADIVQQPDPHHALQGGGEQC
jgi:chromatin segregation and condensation protein Rec8/ScpA/Scc1 (kleisin family)